MSSNKYFPVEGVHVRVQGSDLVLVDTNLDHQESAILLTLGHRGSDLSESMISGFVEELIRLVDQSYTQ